MSTTPTGKDNDNDEPEPVALEVTALEITDTLDLHSFPPSQVKALVADWLELAYQRGYRQLRIIHGRGAGVQRRMVRALLERHHRVRQFSDAPGNAGGWGATVVELADGASAERPEPE